MLNNTNANSDFLSFPFFFGTGMLFQVGVLAVVLKAARLGRRPAYPKRETR